MVPPNRCDSLINQYSNFGVFASFLAPCFPVCWTRSETGQFQDSAAVKTDSAWLSINDSRVAVMRNGLFVRFVRVM